ncbi:MAG: hypothetical protein IJJ33_07495 [Victivallales bacterium]|nr:hypothetical protein [Victivallales bacterium]
MKNSMELSKHQSAYSFLIDGIEREKVLQTTRRKSLASATANCALKSAAEARSSLNGARKERMVGRLRQSDSEGELASFLAGKTGSAPTSASPFNGFNFRFFGSVILKRLCKTVV